MLFYSLSNEDQRDSTLFCAKYTATHYQVTRSPPLPRTQRRKEDLGYVL